MKDLELPISDVGCKLCLAEDQLDLCAQTVIVS